MKIYENMEQGSEEWHKVRQGVLTASEMKLIITPTLKVAANKEKRTHVYEIAAQRITEYTEPKYFNSDMMRGHEDEIDAIEIYSENYAPVKTVGFITNDKYGFTLGFSPDGLVDEETAPADQDDGFIEVKSRMQKHQLATIIADEVPAEYMLQIQTGMLVTERKWCDFISYCGGMPMKTLRVYADIDMQSAILKAAEQFENEVAGAIRDFEAKLADDNERLIETERREEMEIVV